ncbi:unnamed protein product [Vicia faba]|uniref:Uncharacterized protein n=1 Tax=Vicia faba TaxID=3906 RepID=A0AAV1ADS6_VICFA|nr:unnamed protein product [Vicia faba]
MGNLNIKTSDRINNNPITNLVYFSSLKIHSHVSFEKIATHNHGFLQHHLDFLSRSSSSSSPSLFRKYGNVLVLKRFQVRVALTATYVWSVCNIRWSLFVAISTAGPAFTNGLTKHKRSRRKSCNVQYANQKFQNHHLFRSTVAAKPHRLPKAMLSK